MSQSFFSAPVQLLLVCTQVTWLRSKRPLSKLSGDTNSEQNFCTTLSVQVQCDLAFRARARKALFQDMQCFAYGPCVVCCAVSPSCQKNPQMEGQPVRLYIYMNKNHAVKFCYLMNSCQELAESVGRQITWTGTFQKTECCVIFHFF